MIALIALLSCLRGRRSYTPAKQRALAERLNQIVLRSAARPIQDRRSADEICGYDAMGLPS